MRGVSFAWSIISAPDSTKTMRTIRSPGKQTPSPERYFTSAKRQ